MQHHTAREMAADLHGCDTRHNFLGIAVDEYTFPGGSFAAEPEFVFCGEVDWAVKHFSPN